MQLTRKKTEPNVYWEMVTALLPYKGEVLAARKKGKRRCLCDYDSLVNDSLMQSI